MSNSILLINVLNIIKAFNPLKPMVFSETLVPKGGHSDSPPPSANSKTEDAKTMKLLRSNSTSYEY